MVEVLDVFLRAEGFSCILGVLYGGPEISKLQFSTKKKISAVKFFNLFGDQNPGPELDLDPQLEKMQDLDPH
jgi:hypothetical protein